MVALFLSSCSGIKPGATKSGKKYYETFFVGEEGTQFFVKPFIFENRKLNEEAHLDFTFRYKDNLNSNARINYSLYVNEIIRTVDSMNITTPIINITNTENTLLFNERTKNNFKSRFSTEVPMRSLKKLFENDDWEIHVYAQGKKHTFYSSNKTNKKVEALNHNVFVLFQ
ncbi:hypothetical protein DIT68_14220 [Brumimicrobium oceani]|uniref:Uncharacterized protein n=2 Tax=Brumimicrobium oceani TaxID=2100725 RepID=A0A2U2X394_9FLAO|nr:hypothetical protein DIT68_14220 [Brumimicrobium oceani]